ncbi:unnamed protein product [Penicillium nalgiovense]|uniref:Uncharacterized protein n=1 Tax=Penicillium nalgiovense TaxID=60175 RepID=A0A9W4HGP5_PENNA|nr:unnamed protein product [Penicillium nalgiovense]CAG7968231.1 unnamed protein product [Penicillium nalgiovense]CAG7972286.1 unnamed protein product [Penicillium nalgiovense]CAG7980589.1 unnamed protein product [Penicillium nalgiovense]CAG7996737.1 unnamed protein product [Penicillium nalgiovense]
MMILKYKIHHQDGAQVFASSSTLDTRILVPSTTKRCLHGLEGLLVADMSLRRLLLSQMSLRGALLTQDLGCGELGNAAVSCRELVNAAVSCGSHLSSQRPPAEFTW